MRNSKVSIIVPCYNQGIYLDESNQYLTLDGLEILIENPTIIKRKIRLTNLAMLILIHKLIIKLNGKLNYE